MYWNLVLRDRAGRFPVLDSLFTYEMEIHIVLSKGSGPLGFVFYLFGPA